MFYPAESLRRGGRFYLCWVADSWPLRFAAITHRQLWSHDIRKLCDDLMEVVTNESGRPVNRFSLRLSSQLMRGLVRLYEKKVTVLLGDLCMIHAHVFKNTNKKWTVRETMVLANVERPLLQLPRAPIYEEVEPEQRVEEMIQNSGNVVSNIQDITLKEATIPDFQMPPNDGFGEEHPSQAFQLAAERTMEQMLVQPDAAGQHSGLDLPLDSTDTDRSHDRTRLVLGADLHMEPMSDFDKTLFRKSTGEELRPDFEKDIPDIPEIPPPPVPEPEKTIIEQTTVEISEPEPAKDVPEQPKESAPVDIELEALEDQPQSKKRRTKRRLIVDKKIKIDSDVLRERINNPLVELRCEDPTDDIIDLRVSWDVYSRRPAAAGHRYQSRISNCITRLFKRNLAFTFTPRMDMHVEEVLDQPRGSNRATLPKIIEEEEPPVQEIPQIQIDPPNTTLEINVSRAPEEVVGRMTDQTEIPMELVVENELNVLSESRQHPNVQEPMDISDLPTQKLETLSQQKKRVSEVEKSPKKQRLVGYMSFRENQSQGLQLEVPKADDKENVPPGNEQTEPAHSREEVPNISSMLQEAGLSEVQAVNIEQQPERQSDSQGKGKRHGSESSETPLGSLDRTKVSLGDSIRTTDSQKFIRNHWGIEGTMLKIMNHIKAGLTPLSVDTLISRGPVMPGYKKIIAARCFTSILKLKQHEFIKIDKDPETLEIRDIFLGPKLSGLE